jgi:hypothetical protein
MRFFTIRLAVAIVTLCSTLVATAQVKTNEAILRKAAAEQAAKEKATYQQLQQLAKQRGWEMTIKLLF